MQFERFLQVAGHHKWVIVLVVAVVVSATGLGTLRMRPVYSATAVVRMAFTQDSSRGAMPLGYAQQLLNTASYLLGSRPFLETTISRLQLTMQPEDLDEIVRTQVVANTELLEVTVESSDPRMASDIANALASLLVEAGKTDDELRLSAIISVQSPAAVASIPVRPRLPQNLAFAALVGILGGFGLAVVLERFDHRIRSADGLGSVTGSEPLEVIPRFAGPSRLSRQVVVLRGRQRDRARVAFQTLAAVLSSSTPGSIKSLLIVSAEPRAGRSTVVANLAATLARMGERVVVVDSDLVEPRLDQGFSVRNTVGLSSMAEMPGIDRDPYWVEKALQQTSIDGVRVLTSGPRPYYPERLVTSSELRRLIAYLREGFDWVLLDSAPISVLPGTVSLAHMVDGVLLVVAQAQDTDVQIRAALQLLNKIGANVLGTVLNQGGRSSFRYLPGGRGAEEADARSRTILGSRALSLISDKDGEDADAHPRSEEELPEEDARQTAGPLAEQAGG